MFALLAPQSKDPDVRNRELVLNSLLFGTAALAISALVIVTVSYWMGRNHTYWYSAAACLSLLGLAIGLFWQSRWRRHYYFAAYALVGLYFLIAVFLAMQWGLQLATSILLFGFVIVLAGIVVSSRFSLYMVGVTLATMGGLEWLIGRDVLQPNLVWKDFDTALGDLVGFGIVYSLIALVSWLFNHQMEQSLVRARRSEAALLKQKRNLEITVTERTRQLAEAQLEKVEQIYRFAELGRLSSALFHDLANHITSVALDIEGIHQKEGTAITERAQDTVNYLDDVVRRVRRQLSGQSEQETFLLFHEIEALIKILRLKAQQVQVEISLDPHDAKAAKTTFHGDLTRFRQLVHNLIANAIEAYSPARTGQQKRSVTVQVYAKPEEITLRVTDNGSGIPPELRQKIFEPFYSTKSAGTGIGLFVVRQIAEQDFGGDVKLLTTKQRGTTFQVRLPR
jgi:signal transduction histidine kinase